MAESSVSAATMPKTKNLATLLLFYAECGQQSKGFFSERAIDKKLSPRWRESVTAVEARRHRGGGITSPR